MLALGRTCVLFTIVGVAASIITAASPLKAPQSADALEGKTGKKLGEATKAGVSSKSMAVGDPYFCHSGFTLKKYIIPEADTSHIIAPQVAGATATLWVQRWCCICTSCYEATNTSFNWYKTGCNIDNCNYAPNASKPNEFVNVPVYWKFEGGVPEEHEDTLKTTSPANEAETIDKLKDLFNTHQLERLVDLQSWGLYMESEQQHVPTLGESAKALGDWDAGANVVDKQCNSCNHNSAGTHITDEKVQTCVATWPVGMNKGPPESESNSKYWLENTCPDRVDPSDKWGQTTPSRQNSGEWLMTEPGFKATLSETLDCPACTEKVNAGMCKFWGGQNNDKYCVDWSIPSNCVAFSFPEMEDMLGGRGAMTDRLVLKLNELEGDPCNTCDGNKRRNADDTECWNTASLKWTLPKSTGGGYEGHIDCPENSYWKKKVKDLSGERPFGWDPYCHDPKYPTTWNHVRDFMRDGRSGWSFKKTPRNGIPMKGLSMKMINDYNIPYSELYNAQYLVVGRNAEAAWKGRLTKGWSPFRVAASVLKCTEADGQITVKGNTFSGEPFNGEDGKWCDGAVTRPMLDLWFREMLTDVRVAVIRGNKACDAGNFAPDRNLKRSGTTQHNQCTPCGVGKAAFTGLIGCINCGPGQYADTKGLQFCKHCPEGRISKPTSSGAFSEQGPTVCESCQSGKYAPKRSSFCQVCPAGKFSATENSPSCTPCAIGKYQSQAQATACMSCAAGKSNLQTGSTSTTTCQNCAAGKWTVGGHACTNCERGRYSSIGGATSSGVCQACAAGKSSHVLGASSSASCKYCDAGKYFTGIDAPCEGCDAGKFSAEAGATSSAACQSCPSGKTSAAASAVCGHCPAGKYGPACSSCTAGKYSDTAAAASCKGCGAGKYSSTQQATACSSCTAGKYSDTAAAASCKGCGAGKYSKGDAAACQGCGAGKYSSTQATACSSCVAGKYSDPSSASCKGCGAGKYSNEDRTAACKDCVIGHYGNTAQATVCQECEVGKSTSQAGSTTCQGCPKVFVDFGRADNFKKDYKCAHKDGSHEMVTDTHAKYIWRTTDLDEAKQKCKARSDCNYVMGYYWGNSGKYTVPGSYRWRICSEVRSTTNDEYKNVQALELKDASVLMKDSGEPCPEDDVVSLWHP